MISTATTDDASGTGPGTESQTATSAPGAANAPPDLRPGLACGIGPDAQTQTATNAPGDLRPRLAEDRFLDVPDLIPARMLNEFAYCPRLSYLEWVQGEFVHNLETLEGRFGHRRVDEPSRGEVPNAARESKGEPCGVSLWVRPIKIDDDASTIENGEQAPEGETASAPASDDVEWQATRPPQPPLAKGGSDGCEPIHARSLMLSAPGEGLICKIDVLELDGDVATPIDYKRGKQPDIPEGAWEPERVQVCAQGLILREAGYRSDEGVLYFIESKRRVPVVFDEALVSRTRELIVSLRRMGIEQVMPPPLVDSPKCPRCSLVGICLPDETNLLHQIETEYRRAGDGHRFEENWSPPVDVSDDDPGFDVDSPAMRPPLPPLPKGGSEEGDPCGGHRFEENWSPRILLDNASQPADRVRRLLPARDDAHPLYVQEQGAMLGKSGDRLTVTVRDKGKVKGKPLHDVRLIDVSQVSLYGNVQVSAQALRELSARGVPVCHFSYGGWLSAITTGLVHKNIELRIRQFAVAADPRASLQLARQFVVGKIKNCRTLLRRHLPDEHPAVPREQLLGQLAELAEQAGRASCVETLLGTEGMAAKLYFAGFARLLKGGEAFDIDGRNRRPPKDPTNALLSFVYSMLARELTVVLQAVGFDPLLGVFHRPRYGRPSLALDLAEEFRPLIADSTVLTLINNGEVSPESFIRRGGAVALTTAGRRAVIEAFERRLETEVTHPLFGYRVSYRRILEVQARLLSRVLLGDLSEYPNFCTR